MRIQYKTYIITPCPNALIKFDLSKVVKIKEGKNKGNEVERNLAYELSLERVFKLILNDIVEENFEEATIDFKEYLSVYSKENEELQKFISRLEASMGVY